MQASTETPQTNELYKEMFQNAEIRIYGTKEKPLFVANDIGALLGIKNIHTTLQAFDDSERATLQLTYERQGLRKTTVLTTAGLYRMLYASKKPIAKEFRHWVARVIDTIVATGHYDLKEDIEKQQAQQAQQDQLERAQEKASQLEESVAEKENEIITLRNENSRLSLAYKPTIVYHDLDINDFVGSACVYLIHLGDDDYKYGKTTDIADRVETHAKYFAKYNVTTTIVKIWCCDGSDAASEIEDRIKIYGKMHGIKIRKYGKTEILQTDDIQHVVAVIDKYIAEQNEEHIAERSVALANNKLAIELELAKIELEKIKVTVSQTTGDPVRDKIMLEQIALKREKLAFEREKFFAEQTQSTALVTVQKQEKIAAKKWVAANLPHVSEPVIDHYARYKKAYPAGIEKQLLVKIVKAQGFRTRKLDKKTRWCSSH